MKRIFRFIKSLLWHIRLGLPKSEKKVILERYAICVGCTSYNKDYQQCNECGCNISNQNIFLNKLAWADQECPLGKWSKVI